MHLEFLIEDASGKKMLESLVERILGPHGAPHTYRFFAYKGIGNLPSGLSGCIDPRKRILLDRLPAALRGYGKAFQHFPDSAVVVIVDVDRKVCTDFKDELLDVLQTCNPAPKTLFRLAIEEMEAWLLGDRNAITKAYPIAKTAVLNRYEQDAVCDTWELLADAIYPGGSKELKRQGWPRIGQAKYEWAERIAPHVDIEDNLSKSFQVFRDGLRRLCAK